MHKLTSYEKELKKTKLEQELKVNVLIEENVSLEDVSVLMFRKQILVKN